MKVIIEADVDIVAAKLAFMTGMPSGMQRDLRNVSDAEIAEFAIKRNEVYGVTNNNIRFVEEPEIYPGEWINTDDMQRCRKTGPHTFELIEADEVDGKFIISELKEIKVNKDIEKYKSTILSFYSSVEEFVNAYPDRNDQEQLIAEMLYESGSQPQTDFEYTLLSYEEAEKVLEYVCKNGCLPDEGYVYGWDVSELEWDTDDDEYEDSPDLPHSVHIEPFETDENNIVEYLSDKYGFCIDHACCEPIMPE